MINGFNYHLLSILVDDNVDLINDLKVDWFGVFNVHMDELNYFGRLKPFLIQ